MSRGGNDMMAGAMAGYRGPDTQLNQFEDQQGQQIAAAQRQKMMIQAALQNHLQNSRNPQVEAGQLQQAYTQGRQRRMGSSMTNQSEPGMGLSPVEKAVAKAKALAGVNTETAVTRANALAAAKNDRETEPPMPQAGSLQIIGDQDHSGDVNETIPADQNQPDVAAAHNAWEKAPAQVKARETQQRRQQAAGDKTRKEKGDESSLQQDSLDTFATLQKLGVDNPSDIVAGKFTDAMKGDDVLRENATRLATTYFKQRSQLHKLQSEQTGGNPAASQQGNGGYSMGQVIQTPKGNVRVTGFDTDGHPLIQPEQ